MSLRRKGQDIPFNSHTKRRSSWPDCGDRNPIFQRADAGDMASLWLLSEIVRYVLAVISVRDKSRPFQQQITDKPCKN